MTDAYYDVPCNVCGEGIPRTGKRGRPPKAHPQCKGQPLASTPAPTVQPPADDRIPADDTTEDNSDEADALKEFLRKPAAKRALISEGDADKIQVLARKLDKGDMLWLKLDRKFYEVRSSAVVGDHAEVRLKGYNGGRVPADTMRIIADGFVKIRA